MDFATFSVIADNLLSTTKNMDANYPVMIRSRHGVGKSELVYQTAAKLGLKVVERRISYMTEGDLMGLPNVADGATSWNHPDWYRECCEQPCVLFFDEVDRGDRQVRQGIMEIGDSRKFNGLKLHPGTIIFAAVNGGRHGSEYQVGQMDPAELDRWVVFDLEPTVEDWLNWSKENVDPFISSFISHNRDHLEHKGSFEPDEVYPTRRSWARLNKVLVRSGICKNPKSDLHLLLNIASGFVGFSAAVALQEYASKYETLMTAEDIVVKGEWQRTQTFSINEHLAMTRKISNSGILETKLPKDHLKNLANYFMVLPSEVAASFWVLFCGKVDENSQNPNMVDFNKTRGDNGLMVAEHYASMLTGKKPSVSK